MTAPLSRRAFLKLSGALGVAVHGLPAGGVRLASTWPLVYPHHYFPNPETLIAQGLSNFDLLLIPAYTAAELIQAGALQTWTGLSGRASAGSRAHDPEGAFTLPYHYQTVTLPLASAWSTHPRVVIGAALWARGYSPNDTHPGHLAQIEKDLLAHRQHHRLDTATLVVEYDWVIPQGARRALALEFLRRQTPAVSRQRSPIPLMPLPPAARAQLSHLWTRLTANG